MVEAVILTIASYYSYMK